MKAPDTAAYTSSSNANHCPVIQRSTHLMPLFQRTVLTGVSLKTFFFLTERSVSHCPDILIFSVSRRDDLHTAFAAGDRALTRQKAHEFGQFKEGFRVCPISQLEETARLLDPHWHLKPKTLWAFSSISR